MFKTIRDIYWGIIEGISNLIYWIPVVWKDRQFDEYFLFRIAQHKLDYMEKFFRSKDAHVADALTVADNIHKATELLIYIMDNKSEEDGYAEYHEKYPLIETDDLDNLVEYLNRKRNEEEMNLFQECIKREEEIYSSKMNELGELLKREIGNWWD